MNNLQVQIEKVNKDQQMIYRKHAKREKAIKEIFDMVYAWGQVNVVVDETAPTFRRAIEELLKI